MYCARREWRTFWLTLLQEGMNLNCGARPNVCRRTKCSFWFILDFHSKLSKHNKSVLFGPAYSWLLEHVLSTSMPWNSPMVMSTPTSVDTWASPLIPRTIRSSTFITHLWTLSGIYGVNSAKPRTIFTITQKTARNAAQRITTHGGTGISLALFIPTSFTLTLRGRPVPDRSRHAIRSTKLPLPH